MFNLIPLLKSSMGRYLFSARRVGRALFLFMDVPIAHTRLGTFRLNLIFPRKM
jgi:hypothetical protein